MYRFLVNSLSFVLLASVSSGQEPIPVLIDDFVRAKTDLTFQKRVDRKGFGTVTHIRTPTSPDLQPVIRMNRDTLYSSAVVDLSADVSATLPAGEGRYTSMHVINQDHYSRVYTEPGTYALTQADIGTRYAFIIWRVFVDGVSDQDTNRANAIQDQITLTGGGAIFEIPDWNGSDVEKITLSLNAILDRLPANANMFGEADEVNPIHHLIATASAWGGMPMANAVYLNVTPEFNDGETDYELIVHDVPVNAFWSITVYNSKGYLEPNGRGAYSLNNHAAKKQVDGSFRLRFGEFAQEPNVLPIMPGWNYSVRLYEPRDAILNGDWTFPKATPVRDQTSEP